MCSRKQQLHKPHNKAKISSKNHFKKIALKPSSIKSTLTYNIHQFKSFKPTNSCKKQQLHKPHNNTYSKFNDINAFINIIIYFKFKTILITKCAHVKYIM